jgi:formylglycine-generating enzyme required for sulfatase activity
VPEIVAAMRGYRPWIDASLRDELDDRSASPREKLHASLALLPIDATQVEYLFDRLSKAAPGELPVLRDALRPHRFTLTPKLWAVLESAKPGDPRLLPGASALASYEPDDARWEALGGKVSGALVSVNPVYLGSWLDALRPVRRKLTPPLAEVFHDKSRPETEHALATNILADYASDDPDGLAELLMVSDPKAYLSLFPVAEKRTEQILLIFQSELAKSATFSWNDPPLDPSWTKPDASLVSRIESAQGILSERFGFCQTMALDEFLTTAGSLRKSGYRPVRLRPYADGHTVRVAAVWARDGRNWRISSGLTADQVRKEDERNAVGRGSPDPVQGADRRSPSSVASADSGRPSVTAGAGSGDPRPTHFVPVDVAGYIATDEDGKPIDRYAVAWAERNGDDDARLYVGITADLETAIQDRLRDEKRIPRTVHAMVGSDGLTRHCGVWGRPPGLAITGETFLDQFQGNFEQYQADLSDQLLLDIAVSGTSQPQAIRDQAQAALESEEKAVAEIMKAGRPDRRFASVWSSDARFEAIPIYGLDPAACLQKCRELAAQGYRPVSWSLARTTPGGPLVAASVWHRPTVPEEAKDRLAERQARAAVALVRMGKAEEIWPLLRHSPDPRLRSFFLNWLYPLGADPHPIAAQLDRLNSPTTHHPPPATQTMDAILFDPETSMRRALILALGSYGTEHLSPSEREPLDARLLDLYRNDPDSGIHGAAEWTLRQWGQQARVKEVDAQLIKQKDWGERRWFIDGQEETFAIIEGPVEFRMGSPPTEPMRHVTMETPRRVVIPRRFAIAAKEVNIEQWQRFERTHPQHGLPPSFVKQYSPDPDGPMVGITWYIAAEYCNWLSEQAGLPKDQWCYVPNQSGAYAEGMTIPADVLERIGYRLPTEAEWEYACRSGTATSYSFGLSSELLNRYAWYQANSHNHGWSCGSLLPNDLGLFDMLGNEVEWTQDSTRRLMRKRKGLSYDEINILTFVYEKDPRVPRGGVFANSAEEARTAHRGGFAPAVRYPHFGCRPTRTYK